MCLAVAAAAIAAATAEGLLLFLFPSLKSECVLASEDAGHRRHRDASLRRDQRELLLFSVDGRRRVAGRYVAGEQSAHSGYLIGANLTTTHLIILLYFK